MKSPGYYIYGDHILNKQEASERWREGGRPDREIWTQGMTCGEFLSVFLPHTSQTGSGKHRTQNLEPGTWNHQKDRQKEILKLKAQERGSLER